MDDFSCKFYQTVKEKSVTILLELFQTMKEERTLPKSMSHLTLQYQSQIKTSQEIKTIQEYVLQLQMQISSAKYQQIKFRSILRELYILTRLIYSREQSYSNQISVIQKQTQINRTGFSIQEVEKFLTRMQRTFNGEIRFFYRYCAEAT